MPNFKHVSTLYIYIYLYSAFQYTIWKYNHMPTIRSSSFTFQSRCLGSSYPFGGPPGHNATDRLDTAAPNPPNTRKKNWGNEKVKWPLDPIVAMMAWNNPEASFTSSSSCTLLPCSNNTTASPRGMKPANRAIQPSQCRVSTPKNWE